MGGLVSGVTNLLGGSANGSGFTAQSAPILNPTTVGQAQGAYNSNQQALTQQQQLAQALAAQNGIGNQSSVFNQLQGVANGTGPNPAQAMLNQSTGQNVANQAALMAGQRGANANVGLEARQIGQQGAAIQQNAAGQGATLQANQSLNALGQLGGIAGQQVAQQTGAVNANTQAQQQEQQNLLNSINAQNQANVSNVASQNSANAGIAGVNANNSAGAIGGLLNGAGGAAASVLSAQAPQTAAAIGLASGGEVPNPKVAAVAPSMRFSGALEPHVEHMARISHPHMFKDGGKVDAMVSPGEVYLPPNKANKVIKDGKNPLKEGEKIPGNAKTKGDSYSNDTVPKKLEAGGVVIPRSVMESDDPAGNAAKFVAALAKKNGGSKEHGDFKKALKEAIASRKMN